MAAGGVAVSGKLLGAICAPVVTLGVQDAGDPCLDHLQQNGTALVPIRCKATSACFHPGELNGGLAEELGNMAIEPECQRFAFVHRLLWASRSPNQ